MSDIGFIFGLIFKMSSEGGRKKIKFFVKYHRGVNIKVQTIKIMCKHNEWVKYSPK